MLVAGDSIPHHWQRIKSRPGIPTIFNNANYNYTKRGAYAKETSKKIANDIVHGKMPIADVGVLLVGTNDLLNSETCSASECDEILENIADSVCEIRNNVGKIFVCEILPLRKDHRYKAKHEKGRERINNMLNDMVETIDNAGIIPSPPEHFFTKPNDIDFVAYADDTHPHDLFNEQYLPYIYDLIRK